MTPWEFWWLLWLSALVGLLVWFVVKAVKMYRCISDRVRRINEELDALTERTSDAGG